MAPVRITMVPLGVNENGYSTFVLDAEWTGVLLLAIWNFQKNMQKDSNSRTSAP